MLTGSKQEIAQQVANLQGDVREVIVFVEEPAAQPSASNGPAGDVFAEMTPYMTNVDVFDDSREAIYTRMESE